MDNIEMLAILDAVIDEMNSSHSKSELEKVRDEIRYRYIMEQIGGK